jgi:hypothetical protein
MNSSVEILLKGLQNPDELTQSKTLAQLAMLLDKNGIRQQDEVWGMILTDELMCVQLSHRDIREILDRSITIAKSGTLCRSSYLSLVGIIIKNATIEDMEQMFAFFSDIVASPNEDAYGVLAEFTQFLVKAKNIRLLQQMADKFDTVKALEVLQQTGSKDLKESALRTINCLKKPPTPEV